MTTTTQTTPAADKAIDQLTALLRSLTPEQLQSLLTATGTQSADMPLSFVDQAQLAKFGNDVGRNIDRLDTRIDTMREGIAAQSVSLDEQRRGLRLLNTEQVSHAERLTTLEYPKRGTGTDHVLEGRINRHGERLTVLEDQVGQVGLHGQRLDTAEGRITRLAERVTQAEQDSFHPVKVVVGMALWVGLTALVVRAVASASVAPV